jgi:hypothetical protein
MKMEDFDEFETAIRAQSIAVIPQVATIHERDIVNFEYCESGTYGQQITLGPYKKGDVGRSVTQATV